MTNIEIAMEYLRCFCAGDIDGLKPLLASNLRFKGPFHTFHSDEEYLESLSSDPPQHVTYKVLSISENRGAVALFYEYEKPNHILTIAQLFKIQDQQIRDIVLVFDGRGFSRHPLIR